MRTALSLRDIAIALITLVVAAGVTLVAIQMLAPSSALPRPQVSADVHNKMPQQTKIKDTISPFKIRKADR